MTKLRAENAERRTNAKDAETAREAADSLLERKPAPCAEDTDGRRGAGARRKPAEVFDLVALLRERAE